MTALWAYVAILERVTGSSVANASHGVIAYALVCLCRKPKKCPLNTIVVERMLLLASGPRPSPLRVIVRERCALLHATGKAWDPELLLCGVYVYVDYTLIL